MKAPQIHRALLACTLFGFLIPAASGAQWEKLGEAGEWEISGTDGQCQASKQLDPSIALSRFAIGIARKGTYLHFQNLSWRLPSTRTNMMRVKVLFDGSVALRTEALVIRQVRAFQVFVYLTEMPEEVFWKRFLGARSLSVTGKFRPGRADIELKDTEKIPPLLKACAQRYLPGVELPFYGCGVKPTNPAGENTVTPRTDLKLNSVPKSVVVDQSEPAFVVFTGIPKDIDKEKLEEIKQKVSSRER